MILKNVYAAIMCTTLLAWSDVAVADEYRADEFLGLDLSRAALSPKLLGPAATGHQFFPWLTSAPNGRVDLAFYDRACDPNNVLVCVTLSSTNDDGATWSSVAVTSTSFDGDKFQACVQFVDPPNCGVFFLGDYIAVASTNKKAQVMWTGDGPQAMDVFTTTVSF